MDSGILLNETRLRPRRPYTTLRYNSVLMNGCDEMLKSIFMHEAAAVIIIIIIT